MRDGVEERPVWAWIDLDALRHNARRALQCAAGRTVLGVVKADAYGHGAADVARGLLAEGACDNYFLHHIFLGEYLGMMLIGSIGLCAYIMRIARSRES